MLASLVRLSEKMKICAIALISVLLIESSIGERNVTSVKVKRGIYGLDSLSGPFLPPPLGPAPFAPFGVGPISPYPYHFPPNLPYIYPYSYPPPAPFPPPLPAPLPVAIRLPAPAAAVFAPPAPNPIVVPAKTAATLSVASLIHALIARKFYPPAIPYPVIKHVPVPFKVPVPVPVPVRIESGPDRLHFKPSLPPHAPTVREYENVESPLAHGLPIESDDHEVWVPKGYRPVEIPIDRRGLRTIFKPRNYHEAHSMRFSAFRNAANSVETKSNRRAQMS